MPSKNTPTTTPLIYVSSYSLDAAGGTVASFEVERLRKEGAAPVPLPSTSGPQRKGVAGRDTYQAPTNVVVDKAHDYLHALYDRHVRPKKRRGLGKSGMSTKKASKPTSPTINTTTASVTIPTTSPSSSSTFIIIDGVPCVVLLADLLRFMEAFLDHVLHAKCIVPSFGGVSLGCGVCTDDDEDDDTCGDVKKEPVPSSHRQTPPPMGTIATYALLCEVCGFGEDGESLVGYGYDAGDEAGGGGFSMEEYLANVVEECDGVAFTSLFPEVTLKVYRVCGDGARVTMLMGGVGPSSPTTATGRGRSAAAEEGSASCWGPPSATVPLSDIVAGTVTLPQLEGSDGIGAEGGSPNGPTFVSYGVDGSLTDDDVGETQRAPTNTSSSAPASGRGSANNRQQRVLERSPQSVQLRYNAPPALSGGSTPSPGALVGSARMGFSNAASPSAAAITPRRSPQQALLRASVHSSAVSATATPTGGGGVLTMARPPSSASAGRSLQNSPLKLPCASTTNSANNRLLATAAVAGMTAPSGDFHGSFADDLPDKASHHQGSSTEDTISDLDATFNTTCNGGGTTAGGGGAYTTTCPICIETLGTVPCVTTICGHVFHIHCYAKIGSQCPLCRFELTSIANTNRFVGGAEGCLNPTAGGGATASRHNQNNDQQQHAYYRTLFDNIPFTGATGMRLPSVAGGPLYNTVGGVGGHDHTNHSYAAAPADHSTTAMVSGGNLIAGVGGTTTPHHSRMGSFTAGAMPHAQAPPSVAIPLTSAHVGGGGGGSNGFGGSMLLSGDVNGSVSHHGVGLRRGFASGGSGHFSPNGLLTGNSTEVCALCVAGAQHRPAMHTQGSGGGGDDNDHLTPSTNNRPPPMQTMWLCLVCGATHGGRESCNHAAQHFASTGHRFAVDVHAPRVWDYRSGTYVHRLVQQLQVVAESRERRGATSANNDDEDNGAGGSTTNTTKKTPPPIWGSGEGGSSYNHDPKSALNDDSFWVDYGFYDEDERARLLSSVDFVAEFYSKLLEDQLKAQQRYYEVELATMRFALAVGRMGKEEVRGRAALAREWNSGVTAILKPLLGALAEGTAKMKATARRVVEEGGVGTAIISNNTSSSTNKQHANSSASKADDVGLATNQITLEAAKTNLEAVRKMRAMLDSKEAAHKKSLVEKDKEIKKLQAKLEGLYAQL